MRFSRTLFSSIVRQHKSRSQVVAAKTPTTSWTSITQQRPISAGLHQSSIPTKNHQNQLVATLSTTTASSSPLLCRRQHQNYYCHYHRFFSSSAAASEVIADDIDIDSSSDNEGVDEYIPPRFDELHGMMHPKSIKAVTETMGITNMTEIQGKTFEKASSGYDVLGRARTGTGKTLAFLLPGIEQILKRREEESSGLSHRVRNNQIEMIILSPTRELAQQIGEQTRILCEAHNSNGGPSRGNRGNRYNNNNLSYQVIVGGTSKFNDTKQFNYNLPNILVATPGRLQDHLENTWVGRNRVPFSELVSTTKVIVLDEMDRLLDMGFKDDVERIISYLPSKNERQTLLFSATLPSEVREVIDDTLKPNYDVVDCVHDHCAETHTNAQIQQSHVILPTSSRLVCGTVELLLHTINSNDGKNKVMVFFPTTNLVKFYSNLFNNGLGTNILEIHSKKSQSSRTNISNKFRNMKYGILFTSDVSARGVDYPDVTHVIQVGMPDTRESYIHRLGRTGRAGKKGKGLLVLSCIEKNFINEKLNGLDVPVNDTLQEMIDNKENEVHYKSDILKPILDTIEDKSDYEMNKLVKDAYMSMIGYYSAKLHQINTNTNSRQLKDDLIHLINSFSLQAGYGDEPPQIKRSLAQNLGLANVRGINISDDSNRRGGGGRYGGGGSSGGGRFDHQRRGGRDNNDSYGRGYGGGGGGGRGFERPPRRNNSYGEQWNSGGSYFDRRYNRGSYEGGYGDNRRERYGGGSGGGDSRQQYNRRDPYDDDDQYDNGDWGSSYSSRGAAGRSGGGNRSGSDGTTRSRSGFNSRNRFSSDDSWMV